MLLIGLSSVFDFDILGNGNTRFKFSCCKAENFWHDAQELQGADCSNSQLISFENSIAHHSFPQPTGPEKR